jgi:biopolymer transport protein ExbD
MKKLTLLFVVLMMISCQKEIELVKANRTIDSTVVDHSPIYIFLDTKGKDTVAEVNRKNTIGTTNWIFHVDKRLPLNIAIPEIVGLQERRDKAQFHKNEEAGNFYSYTDSVQKTLAFLPFKEVNYSYNSYFSTVYIKENPDYHLHFQTFSVNFKPKNKVSVDGNEVEMSELFTFLKEYTAFSSNGKRVLIYLNFDERLTFNQYLSKLIELKALENDMVSISPIHFIYDKKKLPDCDCGM